jgi:glycosyltransferase involved in cell wall biosynthesis
LISFTKRLADASRKFARILDFAYFGRLNKTKYRRGEALRIDVIIPAHNEEAVIHSCISNLIDERLPSIHPIVVVNGTTDRTAAIARSFGDSVTVVETEIASKSHALNLGNEYAKNWPRIYLDADIIVSADAIRKVVSELEKPGVFAASPKLQVDTTGSQRLVRLCYDFWLSLPYAKKQMVGSGIYGLSKTGFERLGEFPETFADDNLVRLLFSEEERSSLSDCSFTVTAPATIDALVKIKTRVRRGNKDLAEKFPKTVARSEDRHVSAILQNIFYPWRWPQLFAYVYVKWLIYRQPSQRGGMVWDRDETSRNPRRESPTH